MHLKKIIIHPEKFPTREHYPFNLEIFHQTGEIVLNSPITIFVGENGTGKSTLLRAISKKCGIYIWEGVYRTRYVNNPYEKSLYKALKLEWENGIVPGSFFESQRFQNYAGLIDEWACSDAEVLKYYGGSSLVTKSHGQSLMSYFTNRYRIKGIYFLDEPETALSPKTQLELLKVLSEMAKSGHAQFIMSTHSPILLSCPGAEIYSFDSCPLEQIEYTDTDHYKIYRDFMGEK